MATPTSRIILNQAQLAALGGVAAESAYLENLLNEMLQDVSGLSKDQLQVFTSRWMLAQKLEAVRDLGVLKLRSIKKRNDLAAIISELKTHNTQRTIAIHGVWMSYTLISELLKTGEIKSSPPVAKTSKGKVLKVEELLTLADRIHGATAKLSDFYVANWFQGKALQRVRKILAKERERPPAR